MSQFSIGSAERQGESHCLELELGVEQFGDWRGNSIERSGEEEEIEGGVLSEFDHGDIFMGQQPCFVKQDTDRQPAAAETVGSEPSLEEERQEQQVQAEEEEQKSVEEGKSSQSEEGEQAEDHCHSLGGGITFYEQSKNETTVVHESQLQANWKEGTSIALQQFMSMCQSSYDPLISQHKAVVERLEAYDQKSMANLDMYCFFFKIKQQQQQQRLAAVRAIKKAGSQLQKQQLLKQVYLDQKIVIDHILMASFERKQALESFVDNVSESVGKIRMLLQKAVQNRKKGLSHVKTSLDRMQRIREQLVELLGQSPSVGQQGWNGRADIRSDRYLQQKYLQERENLFLSILKETNQSVSTLLSNVFVKEEPIIWAVIAREVNRYSTFYQDIYGSASKTGGFKLDFDSLQQNLAEQLGNIIPQEWCREVGKTSSQEIVNKIHDFLSNQIYMNCLEISDQYLLYKGRASWNTHTTSQKENKFKEGLTRQQPSCNALVTQRQAESVKAGSMQVNVVLTVDKFLHLECGQKVASLKLRRLKLSRKANSILLTERTRSITSLFSLAQPLGELTFGLEEQAEVLASRLIGCVGK